jgi:hypothetical protein
VNAHNAQIGAQATKLLSHSPTVGKLENYTSSVAVGRAS